MSGMITAAVVTAGVGLYSASKSADATQQAGQQAADTSLQVAEMNNQLAADQYNQTRSDQEPWRLAGERALQSIEAAPDFQFNTQDFVEMGSKGADFQFDPKEFVFEKDPSYDFRKQEGINALDRSAASRGRVLSGAQDRAVTRYGSNLASTEYQNAFNRHQTSEMDRYNIERGVHGTNENRRLANENMRSGNLLNQYNAEKGVYNTNMNTDKSMAGVGQDAVNNIQNAGQNMVNSVSNSNTNAGNTAVNAINASGQAQSAMYGNAANAINTGISGVATALLSK